MSKRVPLLATVGVAACLQATLAQNGAEVVLPEIEIVGTSPLSSGAERDKVPATTQVLRRDDLTRTGPSNALRTLDQQAVGVTLDEAQGNAFQPNLIYRGFEASPLVGNPQGLAVYLNGTRFNSPFGDTTDWDLIPDIAINRLELSSSNPAFGLNALGGSLAVRLRDGFSYQGAEIELSGGSFGRIRLSGQYGIQRGNVAAYIAATGLNEDGWRVRSPSQLRQIYGDIGFKGEKTEIHLSLLGALNNLTGHGTAPIELLAAQRNANFTTPDITKNSYLRAMLNGSTELNDRWSLQANAYVSLLSSRIINGNASDATPCADDSTLLCLGDGTPLTGRDGARIPNFVNPGYFGATGQFPNGGPYSILNQTTTSTTGYGAQVQATYKSELFGRPNRLLIGASYDGGATIFSANNQIGALSLDRAYTSPGITIAQEDGSIAPVRFSAQNNHYGIYAQSALDITSALTLTLSGRFNATQIDLRDQLGAALTGRHDFTHFNPAAGLTYKILPSLTAYAGYSVANRTPTPAELSCASPSSTCTLANFFVSDPSLKQVTAQTFEAGLRGRVGFTETTVNWSAGVFRTTSDDDILFVGSQVLGNGYFQNVGTTRRQGVEAGLTVVHGPVNAFVNYAYTNATFQTPFTAISRNNPFAAADGTIQVQRGNQIPGIPQHLLKFGVQYDVTPSWSAGTTGIVSSGRVLLGDPSNLNPRTDSYVVLNLNTRYRITEKIELFGEVQNLFDARYATFGGFAPTGVVPILQAPGASNPRSMSLAPPLAGFGGVRVQF